MMCRQVVDAMTDESEGVLKGWRRLMYRFHLKICPACQAHHHQVQSTITTLASLPRDPPTSESRDRALEAFRKSKSV
jgi:anti-sigma factor RsiW